VSTTIDHIQCGSDGRHPQGQAPNAVAFVFDLSRLCWWQDAYPMCADCLQQPWVAEDPLTRVLHLHHNELADLRAKVEFLDRQCERLSLIGNEQAVLAWKEVQRRQREVDP
jgi:hypothetical protein